MYIVTNYLRKKLTDYLQTRFNRTRWAVGLIRRLKCKFIIFDLSSFLKDLLRPKKNSEQVTVYPLYATLLVTCRNSQLVVLVLRHDDNALHGYHVGRFFIVVNCTDLSTSLSHLLFPLQSTREVYHSLRF